MTSRLGDGKIDNFFYSACSLFAFRKCWKACAVHVESKDDHPPFAVVGIPPPNTPILLSANTTLMAVSSFPLFRSFFTLCEMYVDTVLILAVWRGWWNECKRQQKNCAWCSLHFLFRGVCQPWCWHHSCSGITVTYTCKQEMGVCLHELSIRVLTWGVHC
jgi:hypothetical protein